MRTDRGRRRVHELRLATALSEVKPAAWAAVAAALFALVIMTILSAREHGDDVRVVDAFPAEDVAAANVKVLPYRQSGLIFSWGNAEPTVLVDRVLWEALPSEQQQDVGQAMAIAKNARVVRVCDSKTRLRIATCTAAGRCRNAGAGEGEPPVTPRSAEP